MKVSRCFVCLGTILFVFMTGVSNAGDYSYKAGIPVWNNPPATWWLDTWRYSGVGGNRHRYNYAVTRVDKSYAPVFRGNKALRFEVRGNRVKGRTFDQANQKWLNTRPADCSWDVDDNGKPMPGRMDRYSDCRENKARAEMYKGGCWKGVNCESGPGGGKNQWYSWNIFIPPGMKPKDDWRPTIGQWHHQHCNNTVHLRWDWDNSVRLDNFAVAPGTSGNNPKPGEDDGWHRGVIYGKSKPLKTGQWHNIRLHINWSTGANGLVSFWMDGKKVVSKRGPTLFPTSHNCGGIYHKLGIYRSALTARQTLVMYVDDHRKGGSLQKMLMAKDSFWGLTKENSKKKNNKDVAGSKNSAALTPTTKPVQVKVKLSDLGQEPERGGDSRFAPLMAPEVIMLNDSVVNNGNIFSFEDYRVINQSKQDGMVLGFRPSADDSFDTTNSTIGYRKGNTVLLYTYDDTLLGYRSNGLMDVQDAETSYVNVSHGVKVKDWKLNGSVTYGRGTGSGHENSFIMDVDTVHAFGFDAQANYKWNEKNSTTFSVAQPLRIESGNMKVMGVRSIASADLTPNGRELMFGINHKHMFTNNQMLVSSLNYTDDIRHIAGFNNASVMVKYKIRF